MRYFGGKVKIAKELVMVLESFRETHQEYYEPFVGGGSVISQMSGVRFGFDKHENLIDMWLYLQKGWIPPNYVSELEYLEAKNGQYFNWLTAFIGFGCSFAGKYFGGYAKDNNNRNYCLNAKNSLLKKMKTMSNVVFVCSDYKNLNPIGKLIYCDPPYKGTTKYAVGDFNSGVFWQIMREWSKNNTVLISEYSAPDDFECVWQKKCENRYKNKSQWT